MMEQFLSHARAMGVVPEKGKAANILPMGEYFLLNVDGEMVEAKTVILATGVSSAKEIPGERELLGRGVSYCATCDGMLYRGKSAVVWGLSPEAAKEANFLQEIGVSVTFVSASAFREGLAEQIPYLSGAVKQVSGKEKVEAVLVNGQELPADGLFILRNSIAPAALVEELVKLEGMTSISININQKNTNVILGEKVETLWGSPYITDYIHLRTGADWQVEGDGIAYRISPQSFYQVNPIQTEKLY